MLRFDHQDEVGDLVNWERLGSNKHDLTGRVSRQANSKFTKLKHYNNRSLNREEDLNRDIGGSIESGQWLR